MWYEKTVALVEKQIKEQVYPGASFAFLRGEKVETHVLGLAQTVPKTEILLENMLYDMASITKVVCTTNVLLKLWEVGKIDIDVPFQVYYPSFEDERVTIRHLLTHTSDINPWIENRDNLSASELKEAFNHLKSGENLGKVFKYTDTGTVLLGFMIENLYGKNAQEVFQQEVLLPLDLSASQFQPVQPTKRAVPTEIHPTRGLIRGWTHDPKAYKLGVHAGSAGLFSTLQDMVHFVQGEFFKKEYLLPSTIDSLLQDYTPTGDLGRSLGWDLLENKTHEPILFHSGFTGTFLLIDVLHQEGFVFLSNRVHPENHREAYLRTREELIATYLEEK
ncbi:MAG: beta-lactamase family protein [Lactobacillales bacterium]|jgi:CubicO group peptidase (beta-lactamase class C family)|nr:beta-lactamase family protein [Lactobacillales bacterium]